MRVTIESAAKRLVLELPAREDEVDIHGMRFLLAFLDGATVRFGCETGDPGVIATVPFTPARGPNRDRGPSSSRTQGAGPVASPPDLGGRE